jgi:peptidoglycan hydrolase-like protein with peptidoglycan-binding domain
VRNRVFRSGSAAALDDDAFESGSRSLRARLMAPIRRHPVDSFGLALMLALVVTALVNALFLQSGKHPAPMRAIAAIMPHETTGSLVMPRPRPAAVPAAVATTEPADPPGRPQAEVIADIQRELARKGFYDGAIDGVMGPRLEAAVRSFEQAAGLRPGAAPDEDLLAVIALSHAHAKSAKGKSDAKKPQSAAPAPPSPRVRAVQRALAEFGYGQLKTTGVFDPATKAAIEKFERERRLPVSGKLSDRLMHELASVTGRPIE